MTETDTAHADAPAADTHDDHGDHGHATTAEPLGPVDTVTWTYALAGGAVGVVVAVVMFIAR